MKLHFSRAASALLALSTSFLLMACGSGNNTAPAGPTTVGGTAVPIAATQDSDAAFTFIASVVARGEADTDNPLALSDAANDPLLATSETADPMPVAA